MLKNLTDWTVDWAATPYGPWALFFIAFVQASFFPIPPDVLLIALALLNPSQAITLAAIATLGSVLGGMFGYFIGYAGGQPILRRFAREEKIKTIHNYFEKYEAWAIFIAGFTPIPYKIFTIAAGVFYINFKKFVLASILGRGGRFFAVASLVFFFGDQIRHYLDKYFDLFSIAFVVLLILGFYLLRRLPSRKTLDIWL